MHEKEDAITNIIQAYHRLHENFQTFMCAWERNLKENEWLELSMSDQGENEKGYIFKMFDGRLVKAIFDVRLIHEEPFGRIRFVQGEGDIWVLYFDIMGNLQEKGSEKAGNSIHNLNNFYRFSEVVYGFIDKYLDAWREE